MKNCFKLFKNIGLATLVAFGACSNAAKILDEEQTLKKKIIASISAYETISENERLYSLTENHIKLNMTKNLDICEIKQLRDFDNNEYTLFELNPTGYIIYHNDSGKYIEYSSSGESPYKNWASGLFYNGAMQYYYEEDDVFYHTLKEDVVWEMEDLKLLSKSSEEMADKLNEQIDTKNISYITGEVEEINAESLKLEKTVQSKSSVQAKVSMETFFPRLDTEMKMGYREGGVCGYIAANLIIAYNYFAYDSGLITNNTFVNKTQMTLNGPKLVNRLLEIAGEDPNGSDFAGTTGSSICSIVEDYFNEITNQLSWYGKWRVLAIDAQNAIDAGYPVALFGSFPILYASGKGNHTIVAYDYAKYGVLNAFTKYRVHYGWHGYADVWLESPIIGTVFFLEVA